MFFKNIEDVIQEKNIICVSPHYDDFLFFLGGYLLEMKARGLLDTKKIINISVFSRSNYQERDVEGNKDQSLKRVQYATGIRIIEDLECLDALLGPHNYKYRVMGEEESQVRGKAFNEGDGEMEMAFSSLETMDEKDHEICDRMTACIAELAQREDTAIVLPLAMKGHIDHFIVQHAGERVMTGDTKATFYFGEDKPYAGLLNEQEAAVTKAFIEKYDLEDRAFVHHPKEQLELAFKHYPSQVDDVYNVGIYERNEQLKKIYSQTCDVDRILKYNK